MIENIINFSKVTRSLKNDIAVINVGSASKCVRSVCKWCFPGFQLINPH
jgi:hypothetical protein